jgi:hypothetical protein
MLERLKVRALALEDIDCKTTGDVLVLPERGCQARKHRTTLLSSLQHFDREMNLYRALADADFQRSERDSIVVDRLEDHLGETPSGEGILRIPQK